MSIRLAVDIGGTFTDVVLDKSGTLTTVKVLTTHRDPARAVMQGIAQVLAKGEVAAGSVELILHGTTLATNALIERNGAKTALLTTHGHRDALEMAFENRFEQYDINIDRPEPLVPRWLRIGIEQRHAADGAELLPLVEEELLAAVDELVSDGVESIAIGYLHSYANPQHEARSAELIAARHPQLSLSLSARVCPEIREYERISTTVANAYVKPLMSRYLASLDAELKQNGFDCQLLMMTSGGGLTTLEAASEYPIRLVESGPAGGAVLAAHVARQHRLDEVLSFDMGGTTAKICLIDGGEPLHSRSFEVDRTYRFKKGSGLPVRIPVIEMVEIGAGGGSLARVDALRRLQVGPESAGSEPGPASYGRGGTEAAVTDADVVLGRLAPELFAGGSLTLGVEAAHDAVARSVGAQLELETDEAAFAVSEVVDDNMASAAKAHASEWGKAVTGRALVAFGGAAPLHAAGLAGKLKISDIYVPAGAGVGSALGFLLSPIRFEVVRSQYMLLGELAVDTVKALFDEMRDEANRVVSAAAPQASLAETAQAFMRYQGQGYEVAVELPDMDALESSDLRTRFESAYRQLYGRTIPDMEIEILSWTLAVTAARPDYDIAAEARDASGSSAKDISYFDGRSRREIPVRIRQSMPVGDRLAGPALVAEDQTTTVVPAGASLEVLAGGMLHIVLQED